MADIAPGWYPDPAGSTDARWWDGVSWSNSTRPQPAEATSPPQQYGQPQYGQPPYGQPNYGQPQYGQPQNGFGQPFQPPAGYPQAGYPQAGYPQAGYPQANPSGQANPNQSGQLDLGTMLQRNKFTAITLAVCIVYALLAIKAHIAVIGVLPVLLSVRAFRAREPFAVVSAVAAAFAVIFALSQLAR